MINSCVRCGTKLKGFFKICGVCQMEVDVSTKPKSPIRPIGEPEDDE